MDTPSSTRSSDPVAHSLVLYTLPEPPFPTFVPDDMPESGPGSRIRKTGVINRPSTFSNSLGRNRSRHRSQDGLHPIPVNQGTRTGSRTRTDRNKRKVGPVWWTLDSVPKGTPSTTKSSVGTVGDCPTTTGRRPLLGGWIVVLPKQSGV